MRRSNPSFPGGVLCSALCSVLLAVPVSAQRAALAGPVPAAAARACNAPGLRADAPCVSAIGHRVAVPRMVPADRPIADDGLQGEAPALAGLAAGPAFQRLCSSLAGEFIARRARGVDLVVDMRPPHPPEYQVLTTVRERLGPRNANPRRWLLALLAEDRWLIEDVLAAWNDEDSPAFAATIVQQAGFRAFEWPQRPLPPPPERPLQAPFPPAGNEAPDDTLPEFLRVPPARSPALAQETWSTFSYDGGVEFFALAPRLGIRARYGFERRGIDVAGARELGIAGRELRVVDLQTGEVLAAQRAFLRFDGPIDAGAGAVCPRDAEGGAALARFLARVLRGEPVASSPGAAAAAPLLPRAAASSTPSRPSTRTGGSR